MKNKRIASILLAMVLTLSIFTSALAASLDIVEKDNYNRHGFAEWTFDGNLLANVTFAPGKYLIELNEKLYNFDEVMEEMDKGKTIEEAVKDLKPVEEPIEDDLKVVEVSAINSTQAEVKFNKEVKEVKPANFKVTDKDGNLVFVSKAELSETKDVATLSFFDKFADKGVYTVEVTNVEDVDGNVMEKDTAKFEYVKADVAKVEFAATTIAPGNNVKDLVKVTDKLGRDVTDEVEIEFESSNPKVVDANGKVAAGTDKTSAIVVAKVKVGDGYVKSAPTTIKVKDATATTFVGYYVYKDEVVGNTDEFAKLDEDKKINYVYEDDYDADNNPTKKLALYYKDQYGKSMNVVPNEEVDVAITNLTPNIVIVEKVEVEEEDKYTLNIKPIYPGEGYVKIKAGEVEHTIKIVVREKAKVATMELDKTDVSVVAGKAEEIVKVVFKDQFDNEIAPAEELKAEVKDDKVAKATVADDKKSITIKGLKEGATTVEVTYKDENNKIDLKETINVTVVKAGELAKYEVVADTTKLDVNGYESKPAKDNKLPKSTTITVYEIDENGNKLGTVEFGENKAELVLVDKDGKELAANAEKVVDIKEGIKNTIEAQKAGTAYVQVKVGTLVVDTLKFEVVDTASTAKTAEFDSVAIVLGEVDSGEYTIDEDKIVEELQEKVTVKDQYGKVINDEDNNDEDSKEVKFAYEITNIDGLEKEKEDDSFVLTKPNASADIVVTKVAYGESDTDIKVLDNLISEPVVVKLSVKDTVAPKIENAVVNLTETEETKEATITDEEITFELNKDAKITNVVVTMSEVIEIPDDAKVQVKVGESENWVDYGTIGKDGREVTITPNEGNGTAAVAGKTIFRIVDGENNEITKIADKAGNELTLPKIVLNVIENKE